MNAITEKVREASSGSRGIGYIVLAVPLLLLGLVVLGASLSEFACSDPTPKQCLADEDKPLTLITGIASALLFFGTAAIALHARSRPALRVTLQPFIVTGIVFSALGLVVWWVLFMMAAVRATT